MGERSSTKPNQLCSRTPKSWFKIRSSVVKHGQNSLRVAQLWKRRRKSGFHPLQLTPKVPNVQVDKEKRDCESWSKSQVPQFCRTSEVLSPEKGSNQLTAPESSALCPDTSSCEPRNLGAECHGRVKPQQNTEQKTTIVLQLIS